MEFEYLSKKEHAHLNELKASLLYSPTEYFFHRIQSIQELKQLTATMGMWQWHYLGSMFSSLINTFKTLGSMFYSLATLRFSIAAEQAIDATKMALSSLLKLTLSFCLFCLQLLRFVSLAITAFFTQIALLGSTLIGSLKMPNSSITDSIESSVSKSFLSVRNYISSLFKPSPKQSDDSVVLAADIKEFKELLLSIFAEKESVNKAIDDFYDWCKHFVASLPSGKAQKVLPDDIDAPQNLSAETIEFGAIRRQLMFLLNNYPNFDESMAFEFGYVKRITLDFSEHHAQMMLLAEEFLKRAHNRQFQALNNSKSVKSSLFFKPAGSSTDTKKPEDSLDPVNQPEDVSSNTLTSV